jgi:defect-in-organelle-trafficking protein DotC
MKHSIVAAVSLLITSFAGAANISLIDSAAGTQTQLQTQRSNEAPASIDSFLNPVSKANTGVTGLRSQMLMEAGKTVGFRGGMAARARVLIEAIKSRSNRLDEIFQFSSLVNKNGTIPPVIVEARDVAAFSPGQIRTADRVYKIEKEERFVSIPPTWKDYLLVGLTTNERVDLPDFDARPHDNNELAVWRAAVREGWQQGEKQSDAILAANFSRLTRDYTGMLLYSTLFQLGKISATLVAESQQTVTGDGKQLVLGDTLRRITNKSLFEIDSNKWTPSITAGYAPSLLTTTSLSSVAPKPIGTSALTITSSTSAQSTKSLPSTSEIVLFRNLNPDRLESQARASSSR